MPHYNNRVKELREERHMTQLRLSFELDVTQETISAYENGKHYPSCKSLLLMASLFDASLDYIMGLSSIRKVVSEEGLPENEVKLLLLYRKLSSAQKERGYAYFQGMLEEE